MDVVGGGQCRKAVCTQRRRCTGSEGGLRVRRQASRSGCVADAVQASAPPRTDRDARAATRQSAARVVVAPREPGECICAVPPAPAPGLQPAVWPGVRRRWRAPRARAWLPPLRVACAAAGSWLAPPTAPRQRYCPRLRNPPQISPVPPVHAAKPVGFH